MRIDLHAHTTCSDGTDTPTELVEEAKAAHLDVLAITDHDTTDGWAEADAAADRVGIRLVRGIELSTKNNGQSQHLLGYEPDPADPALTEMLSAQHRSRHQRIPAILAKLRDLGSEITEADVAQHAGDGTIGRPHIADALVAAGECRDRQDAFGRLLGYGGAAYVPRYSPTIEDAISAINHAGGAAVIAHPWGRETHITEERFAELAACGLAGIEVDHQEHDDAAREKLRAVATNLDLIITGSSDHHGTGKKNHSLGCNTTEADQLERLLEHTRGNGPR